MSHLTVVHSGLLSTVQDLGRRCVGHLGVSPSGAVDWYAARAANRLVNNDDDAPLVETTLTGATFVAGGDATFAVTGALAPISVGGTPRHGWSSWHARAGQRLVIGPAERGARSYLAVRGGFEVARVLGSSASDVVGGFGGRVLAPGDALPIRSGSESDGASGDLVEAQLAYSTDAIPSLRTPFSLRVMPGPDAARLGRDAMARLLAGTYRATPRSSRQGLRLEGEPVAAVLAAEGVSAGVCAGCVQVSADGLPTVLLAEHQTTGGYPVALCVVHADVPVAAQVRPGDTVVFTRVDGRAAHDALARSLGLLRSLAPVGALPEADTTRLGRGFFEGSTA